MLKRITILLTLLLAVSLVLSLSVQPATAIEDPLNVNTNLFWVDVPKDGGQEYLQLYVQNRTAEPIETAVTLWDRYTYPSTEPGQETYWIDPAWISSINPASIVLAPGESIIFNVLVSIPPETPELSYITWLKVSDGKGWEKPITLSIRVGDAVPIYSFAISTGSYYHMVVTGYGAYAIIDKTTIQYGPIGIRSKCRTATKFQAIIEQPKSDDFITQERINDPKSSIFYRRQDELNNNYIALSKYEASSMLTLGATFENPLVVQPFQTAYIPWTLTIPDDLPNGCYLIHVRIKPAEPTGSTINIEYLSQFYIKVDRSKSTNLSWFIPLAIGGTGIALIIIASLGGIRVLARKRLYRTRASKPLTAKPTDTNRIQGKAA